MTDRITSPSQGPGRSGRHGLVGCSSPDPSLMSCPPCRTAVRGP